MSLEDEIRRIVREEIARQQPVMPSDFRVGMMEKCPSCGRKDISTCANTHCFMRPPFVAYKANVTTGHAPAPYERPQPPSYLMGDDLNHRTGERAHHMAAWKDAMKKAYDGAAQQRMGCTCPPGSQTSCPDVTCPWKPR